ncbi:MAG: hypothetical protein AMQ22_00227 [Candidatus Methanofastidiosum methylothiophilum]|uniref:Uncharacterized protein n=1 Tax=Candidatus Methanofastidiosum methylothiophilum TaxID=1705564 RepID=A0A150IS27_9EURY|nr:MAG: hypothetical protein APG11_00816 [Candidatus Methanofastidiosum methylthiophilus]KYC53556.1 MAG: hypothetical protein AMQ22_00227 [Candidatus Methanofastidiosum methylthiophilus]
MEKSYKVTRATPATGIEIKHYRAVTILGLKKKVINDGFFPCDVETVGWDGEPLLFFITKDGYLTKGA